MLTLWLAFRRGELFKEASYTTRLSCSSSFEDIAKCCFAALYYRDPQASSALTNIFSQERSALQSTVRLVWALTRRQSNQKLLDLYCHRLDLRLYGDRLYLLAYDIDDYLSGKESALLHLSHFQELFPNPHYYLWYTISKVMQKQK